MDPTIIVIITIVSVGIFGYNWLQLYHYVKGRKIVKDRYVWLQVMSASEPKPKYEIIHELDNLFYYGDFTAIQTASCSVVFNNDKEKLLREELISFFKCKADDGTLETVYRLTFTGFRKKLEDQKKFGDKLAS